METAFVKFLILWMMCKSIELTMGMPSKDTNELTYLRLKRTPGDFSLFGINLKSSVSAPFAKAKESFSSIGNIFSPNRGNTYQYHQSLPPHRIVQNENVAQSVYITNKNGLANSIKQDGYQTTSKNNEQYQTRNEVPVPDIEQIMNATDKNVSEKKDKITESKPDVDKQVLDFIFQSNPDFDDATTTVDPTYDFTTETGEYENTTLDDLLRIPAPVVASLLG